MAVSLCRAPSAPLHVSRGLKDGVWGVRGRVLPRALSFSSTVAHVVRYQVESCSGVISWVVETPSPGFTAVPVWCFRSKGHRLLLVPGGGKHPLHSLCLPGRCAVGRCLMAVTSLVQSVQCQWVASVAMGPALKTVAVLEKGQSHHSGGNPDKGRGASWTGSSPQRPMRGPVRPRLTRSPALPCPVMAERILFLLSSHSCASVLPLPCAAPPAGAPTLDEVSVAPSPLPLEQTPDSPPPSLH